jgi:hypothetical protein
MLLGALFYAAVAAGFGQVHGGTHRMCLHQRVVGVGRNMQFVLLIALVLSTAAEYWAQ